MHTRTLLPVMLALAVTAAVAGRPAPDAGAPGEQGASSPQAPRPLGTFVEAPAADDPANAGADLSPRPPVEAASPAEQAARFWLPAGYRMEPVLSDPVIQEPAQIAFDGNGRMFVVELRGYEQTLDGLDLTPPHGRISVHEDRNHDGVYEHNRVFVDGLVFPRFVLPFGANTILTMESNADTVWKFSDTNGDGTADSKEVFTANFGRVGHIEIQPSSLFWAMDNWLYSTVNSFRIRWTPSGLLREPTGANGAQWGITQDDDGKVWFQGGASGLPSYFQFPIHYGTFTIPDQLEPDLHVTWGAPILVGDIQAGVPGTRVPDGSLIRATAGAGNDIYRGHRLPPDLVGDYLYGEVVARSVRRLRPVRSEGLTQLRNAHPRSEFIRSIDPLFRPVDVATAPDGTLYIVDMYRGVMEGAPWAKEGTYLRKKIEQYQLDRIRSRGRIWRLTYDGLPRDRTPPRMLEESAARLVSHLSHPNGWWRDTAQRLLVLKQDSSVVSALRRLVRDGKPVQARVHALWTLEGLGALDTGLVRELLKDPEPRVRIQAIRASETLYKTGDRSLATDYRGLTNDTDAGVIIQGLLTQHLFKAPDLETTVKALPAAAPRGVREVARQILQPPRSLTFGGRGGGRGGFAPAVEAALQRGATIYREVCATCHGRDGRGTAIDGLTPTDLAPPLLASNRVIGHRDYVIKVLLHGLTGPVDGRAYGVMAPLGANTDEWVAAVATYIRSGFGTPNWRVTEADVARVRAATPGRTAPWTLGELEATLPRALVPDQTWKASASHNPGAAGGGLNISGWSTRAPQEAGMWFQVELPGAVTLTEVEFESPALPGTGNTGPAYPRAFQVQLSSDGERWTAPLAEARGAGSPTAVSFPPTPGRFVRISLTETDMSAPAWNVRNLRLFEVIR